MNRMINQEVSLLDRISSQPAYTYSLYQQSREIYSALSHLFILYIVFLA